MIGAVPRELACTAAAMLLACAACRREDAPSPTASAIPAQPAQPGTSNPAPPTVAERQVPSGWSADQRSYLQQYRLGLPSPAPVGAAFKVARASCLAAGRDLCSEEQWLRACAADATLGRYATWTVTPDGSASWVVRGGSACDARATSEGEREAMGRLGFCCEPRAALSPTKSRREAVLQASQVTIGAVEQAINARKPAELARLLAPEALLFTQRTTPARAERDLAADLASWPKTHVRFLRCDADTAQPDGHFECDAVGTRLAADGHSELGIHRQRFSFVKRRYTVFGEVTSVQRPWAPY